MIRKNREQPRSEKVAVGLYQLLQPVNVVLGRKREKDKSRST